MTVFGGEVNAMKYSVLEIAFRQLDEFEASTEAQDTRCHFHTIPILDTCAAALTFHLHATLSIS